MLNKIIGSKSTAYIIIEPRYEKPAFCICENKDADQLRGNHKADQRLCFRYLDSTIPLLSRFEILKPLAIFFVSTAWFVSDLVGNPEDRFSHIEAQFISHALLKKEDRNMFKQVKSCTLNRISCQMWTVS